MPYFLIYQFDTDATVEQFDDKAALLEVLSDFPNVFADRLPDSDPAMWGEQALIIKGEIVTPRSAEKVVSLEID